MEQGTDDEFKTVARVFEDICLKFPNRIALETSNETISFCELERVTRNVFQNKGLLVVVGIEQGKNLAAIEIAIWRANGIICPFDLKDPRASGVLNLLKPDLIVIDDDRSMELLPFPIVQASKLLDWSGSSPTNQSLTDYSQTLSHFIFTSGTTGFPKCVGVTNQSLYKFAKDKVKRSMISENSRIFLASSFTFDPQLGDIACAMITGSCLILPDRQKMLNGYFGRMLVDSCATHVCTTPATMNLLGEVSDADLQKNLTEILIGGEVMPPSLVERAVNVWKGSPKLFNTYGVTECCIYQSTKEILVLGDEKLLGEAYESVKLELVVNGRKAEVGEEGEIVMSGPMIGIGYLKAVAEELRTAKKTRENSFEFRDGFHESGVYHTGDLGKYTEEGEIKYLGRRDSQFKNNGVRIEAGEVEHAIVNKTCGIFSACIVIICNKRMVALCKPQDKLKSFRQLPKCVKTCTLRYLSKSLPQNYFPHVFLSIDEVPMSSNGKIDRKLLTSKVEDILELTEKEEGMDLAEDFKTEIQRLIATTWKEVLGISTISVNDSFVSLGGDSLSALKVVNKLLSKFRERGITDETVKTAVLEAQTFGEIRGAFSAVELLLSPSLLCYSTTLEPFVSSYFTETSKEETKESLSMINNIDPNLTNALIEAAKTGYEFTVKAILELNIISPEGHFVPRKHLCRTPLHEAAQVGHVEVIKILVSYGARVLAVTEAKITPIHLAAGCEDSASILELVKAVRRQRADVKPILVCDKNDQTPLHFAARAGRCQVIADLLNEQLLAEKENPQHSIKGGGLVHALNCFDHWRRTPLHWAVVNFHLEAAKLLLSFGAHILPEGMKIGKPGPGTHLVQETPLQLAIRRNAPAELITLLKNAEENFRIKPFDT